MRRPWQGCCCSAGKTASIGQCYALGSDAMAWLPVGWGRRQSSRRADDPRRAIKIVTLTGQLYATDSKRPIATACATQKVPRPARFGAHAETGPPPIQNRPLVKRLTLPFAGARYVALPSSSGPPERPKGAGGLRTRPQRGGAVAFPVLAHLAKSTTPLKRNMIARRRWFSPGSLKSPRHEYVGASWAKVQ